MDPILAADLAAFGRLLEQTRSTAEGILSGLDTRPAAVPVSPIQPESLPVDGLGLAGALSWFSQRWEPGFSGSAGPRYLGLITGGATPAAVAGDWLTAVLDQNVCGSGDSLASVLERETVGWLAELFALGRKHSGAFVSGATMSNFVGLAIGREWLGEQRGISVAESGAAALGDVAVLSGAPHSSVYKSLSMLGLGRRSLQLVPTLPDREAVDLAALEAALTALGEHPAIVVANAGTVNTVDFDDLAAIVELRQRYRFWLHVDAAFGAFAATSPQHAALVTGIEAADSVCVDLHKWLNVPYDSAVQFTTRPDLQAQVFANFAAYLGEVGDNPDFVHLTPENSRRLRALAAWFSLTAYGQHGHRDIVERNIDCARLLGERLAEVPGLELLAPVRLNVVCATLAQDPTAERISALLAQIAASGAAFVTPTVYKGTPAFRVAFSNWRTTTDDVEIIAETLAGSVAAISGA